MDCDGEDTNSLLSLSQTLLHPDILSSSGLSNAQLSSWPTAPSSSASSNPVVGQLSPVSPVTRYPSMAPSSSHSDSSSLRIYGYRLTDADHSKEDTVRNFSALPTYSQGEVNVQPSQNSFSFSSQGRGINIGGISNSMGYFSASIQSSLGANQGIYYEDSDDLRRLGEEKEGGQEEMSMDMTDHRLPSSSGQLSQVFSDTSSYSLSMGGESGDVPKSSNAAIDLDQAYIDSRLKHAEFSKDVDHMNETVQSDRLNWKHNMGSAGLALSFDKRQMDSTNFDTEFDFPSSSREFSAGDRLFSSLNRSSEQAEYHSSQVGVDYVSHDNGLQKFPAQSMAASHSFSTASMSVGPPLQHMAAPKRTQVISGGYPFLHDDSGLSESHKKLQVHQFNDFPSDLDPILHDSQTDFMGHEKASFTNQKLTDNDQDTSHSMVRDTNESINIEKWASRSRAHRKMARLLGGDDQRDKLSTPLYLNRTSSSSKQNPSIANSSTVGVDSSGDHHSKSAGLQNKLQYHSEHQKEMGSSSQTFLTMEEELDLRTNQHRQRFSERDTDMDRLYNSERDMVAFSGSNLGVDPNLIPLPKDNSILNNQPFLSSAPLDLEFHHSMNLSQPSKDNMPLDLNQQFVLQVPKDFDIEPVHGPGPPDDLCFDTQHDSQQDLNLTDNLGITSHTQHDLGLEAYFSSGPARDLSFPRKIHKDLTYMAGSTENDFNIEEYMSSQGQRDISQDYTIDRAHFPQDMTMVQKTGNSLDFNAPKMREKPEVGEQRKQPEISELQKELTKGTSKESMKGLRTPRDINRAMEVLQGLEQEEKEEARRKQELQQKQSKQHHHQYQQSYHHHQQQQQQQQQHTFEPVSTSSLSSSLKKTFQTKHQLESMSFTDQTFLGVSSGSGFVEGSEDNLLESSTSLHLTERHGDPLQTMTSYQTNFTAGANFTSGAELSQSCLSSKRDVQSSGGLNQSVTSEPYQALKRHQALSLAHGEVSLDPLAGFTSHPTTVTAIQDITFPLLDTSSKVSNQIEASRQRYDLPATENDTRMTAMSVDKERTTASSQDQPHSSAGPTIPSRADIQADVMAKSRESLYIMMKQEQFCDAVLSTPNQTVKVHQAILCSLSQCLCTLLHRMRRPPSESVPSVQSSKHGKPSCSSKFPLSQGVLLFVNCDSIKATSMSTFLQFIYLGTVDFTSHNITDLFVLASCLKISALKDLCVDFMQESTNLSEDQIKIPQLLVSNQHLEMRDKSVGTNLDLTKKCEDRAVNTGMSAGRINMDASTQTDKSTSVARERSQEEWIMLKKTKQKTVSPSKSRLNTKSSTTMTDSSHNLKGGKKGWFSPKRRQRVENISDTDSGGKTVPLSISFPLPMLSMSSANTDSLPHSSHHVTNNQIFLPSTGQNVSVSDADKTMDGSKHSISLPAVLPAPYKEPTNVAVPPSKVDVEIKTTPTKAAARTTVEIAAAAAAAKLQAHNYGTRSARGASKTQVSYAAMASGIDRKKVALVSHKEKSKAVLSKKKEFIQSNPEVMNELESSQAVTTSVGKQGPPVTEMISSIRQSPSVSSSSIETTDTVSNSNHLSHSSNVEVEKSKLPVKRPLKKSIVHRSQSEEAFRNLEDQINETELSVTDHEKKSIASPPETSMPSAHDRSPQLKGAKDISVDPSVGKLIESIVNTMGTESEDTDLQKVIHDLDSQLSTSPVPAPPSSTSQLMTPTSSQSSHSQVQSSPASDSTPPSAPVRSTPQGFRKRLIHQLNAEKNQSQILSSGSLQEAAEDQIKKGETISEVSKTVSKSIDGESTLEGSEPVKMNHKGSEKDQNKSLIQKESCGFFQRESCHDMTQTDNGPTLIEMNSTQEVNKNLIVGTKNLMPGRDETLKEHTKVLSEEEQDSLTQQRSKKELSRKDEDDDEAEAEEKNITTDKESPVGHSPGQTTLKVDVKEVDSSLFRHKIFKRAKKSKIKKSFSEQEGATNTVPGKLKATKKGPVGESLGGGGLSSTGAKVGRQRKHTGSDTEGSTSGSRVKQRKLSGFEDHGALDKVRPPPKKRAKMELQMLKASVPSNSIHEIDKTEESFVELETKTPHEKPEGEDVEDIGEENIMEKVSNGQGKGVNGKAASEMKNKGSKKDSQKKLKSKKKSERTSGNHSPDKTVDDKIVDALKELSQPRSLSCVQYRCTLCDQAIKGPAHTVKHFHLHGVKEMEAIIAQVKVEQRKEEDAGTVCDICGYHMKNFRYGYMSYHKYMKHGIPLPPGWASHKCSHCNKEFFTKYQLQEHEKSHTEDKCFVCPHCGQLFKTRNNFNSHIFHNHSSEKKHVCKVCDKTFKTWTQLKVHVRTHTGERPFQCLQCDYRSNTQGNMKLHLIKTHSLLTEQITGQLAEINKNSDRMTPENLEKIMLACAEKKKATPERSENEPAREKTPKTKKKSSPKEPSQKKMSKPVRLHPKPASGKDKSVSSKFQGTRILQLFTQPLEELTSYPSTLGLGAEESKTGSGLDNSQQQFDQRELIGPTDQQTRVCQAQQIEESFTSTEPTLQPLLMTTAGAPSSSLTTSTITTLTSSQIQEQGLVICSAPQAADELLQINAQPGLTFQQSVQLQQQPQQQQQMEESVGLQNQLVQHQLEEPLQLQQFVQQQQQPFQIELQPDLQQQQQQLFQIEVQPDLQQQLQQQQQFQIEVQPDFQQHQPQQQFQIEIQPDFQQHQQQPFQIEVQPDLHQQQQQQCGDNMMGYTVVQFVPGSNGQLEQTVFPASAVMGQGLVSSDSQQTVTLDTSQLHDSVSLLGTVTTLDFGQDPNSLGQYPSLTSAGATSSTFDLHSLFSTEPAAMTGAPTFIVLPTVTGDGLGSAPFTSTVLNPQPQPPPTSLFYPDFSSSIVLPPQQTPTFQIAQTVTDAGLENSVVDVIYSNSGSTSLGDGNAGDTLTGNGLEVDDTATCDSTGDQVLAGDAMTGDDIGGDDGAVNESAEGDETLVGDNIVGDGNERDKVVSGSGNAMVGDEVTVEEAIIDGSENDLATTGEYCGGEQVEEEGIESALDTQGQG